MGVTAFNRGSRAVSQRIDVEMQLTRNSYGDHGAPDMGACGRILGWIYGWLWV